jgi:hypothetical protein
MALPSFLSSVPFSPQGLLSVLFASRRCEPANSNLDSTTYKPPPVDRKRKQAYLDFGILIQSEQRDTEIKNMPAEQNRGVGWCCTLDERICGRRSWRSLKLKKGAGTADE